MTVTSFGFTTADQKTFLLEWADRLESGDYIQGPGRLRSYICDPDPETAVTVRNCCLGVACEIGVDRGWLERVEDAWGGYYQTKPEWTHPDECAHTDRADIPMTEFVTLPPRVIAELIWADVSQDVIAAHTTPDGIEVALPPNGPGEFTYAEANDTRFAGETDFAVPALTFAEVAGIVREFAETL